MEQVRLPDTVRAVILLQVNQEDDVLSNAAGEELRSKILADLLGPVNLRSRRGVMQLALDNEHVARIGLGEELFQIEAALLL